MVSSSCLESDGNEFQFYFNELKRFTELELARLIPAVTNQKLYEKIRYAISSSGKRLRPILVLMSAEAVGGRREDAKQLALAIELMHTASLVHDDILDGDMIRRNTQTVNARWTVEDAILTGDALISLSLSLMAHYGENILKLMAGTGMTLCEGEYLDVGSTIIPSESEYLERIEKKCASLFKAATKAGAIVGGGSQTDIETLMRFGDNFGIAFQINDDLSDIVPKEGVVPQDLKEYRINLPIIHLYESLKCDEKDLLIGDLKSLNSKDQEKNGPILNNIFSRLKDSGSIEYCRSKVDLYVGLSLSDLSSASFNTGYFRQISEMLRNNNC